MEYLIYAIAFAAGFVAAWMLKSRLVAPVLARQRGIDLVVEDLQRTNYRLEEQAHELREAIRKATPGPEGGGAGPGLARPS